MKLKDNLYHIKGAEHAPERHAYTLGLNAECVIYKAHFPGMPVTPGVCIVQLVNELLEDALSLHLSIAQVKNAKFLSVLRPQEQDVLVTLSKIKQEGHVVSTQAVIASSEGENYAKISLQAVAS